MTARELERDAHDLFGHICSVSPQHKTAATKLLIDALMQIRPLLVRQLRLLEPHVKRHELDTKRGVFTPGDRGSSDTAKVNGIDDDIAKIWAATTTKLSELGMSDKGVSAE